MELVLAIIRVEILYKNMLPYPKAVSENRLSLFNKLLNC